MKKYRVAALCAVAAGIALAAGTYAVGQGTLNGSSSQFRARLNGYEETPAVFTTGRGRFNARLRDGVIEYVLEYAALEGTTTSAAHIHFGQRDVAGGVSAFLCGGGDKPPCPPTAGTVSGEIDAADVIGPASQGIAPGEFNELVEAMRDGMTYVNVHTNKHPGGEIRGQINDGRGNNRDRDD